MSATAQHANKQTSTKVDPQGQLCMFGGYYTAYAGDVYHFIHSKTNQIIYSHNVQWLNELWGEYYKVSPEDCLKCFINPVKMMVKMTKILQPCMLNIKGNVVEDQEPEIESDEPCTSHMQPNGAIAVQSCSSFI